MHNCVHGHVYVVLLSNRGSIDLRIGSVEAFSICVSERKEQTALWQVPYQAMKIVMDAEYDCKIVIRKKDALVDVQALSLVAVEPDAMLSVC